MAYAEAVPEPSVGGAYGHGWRQLWKYFLPLLLIGIITLIIGSGQTFLDILSELGWWALEEGDVVGVLGLMLGLWGWFLSLGYGLLVIAPVNYGVAYAYAKAARNDRVDVMDMFEAFRTYLNAVLANVLVTVIVVIGFFLLIVPGIIFACKLVFTPYLVVDRKMSAIDAIQESWRMTTGHAWTVFFIGLLSIPIVIAGLLCFIVGVVISIMWTMMAFAALYHAVDTENAQRAGDDYYDA